MKVHGRFNVLKIDDAAGVLQDVSAKLTKANYTHDTDADNTATFGDSADEHEVPGIESFSLSLEGFVEEDAAGKFHGRSLKIFHGGYDVSAYFDTAAIGRQVPLDTTKTFGGDWQRREVPGNHSGSLSLGGFHDAAPAGSYELLRQAVSAASGTPMTLGPRGSAVGKLVEMLKARYTKHDIPTDTASSTKTSAEAKADGGYALGRCLHDATPETASGNAASVDETAATSQGGIGHLHVLAWSGSFTGITVKIQHSVDNSVWVDLITFAAASAIGSERLEVAGTVNRYVRALWTFAGAGPGSATIVVAFARKGFTYGAAGTYRHWVGLLQHANTQTFEGGPDGATAGKPKITGELRMASLTMNVSAAETVKFSAELMNDDTINFGATF